MIVLVWLLACQPGDSSSVGEAGASIGATAPAPSLPPAVEAWRRVVPDERRRSGGAGLAGPTVARWSVADGPVLGLLDAAARTFFLRPWGGEAWVDGRSWTLDPGGEAGARRRFVAEPVVDDGGGWAFTSDHSLLRFGPDGAVAQRPLPPVPRRGGELHACRGRLHVDAEGGVWVLDAGELSRWDGTSWETLPAPPDAGWTGANLAVGEDGEVVVAAVRREPPRSYDPAGSSLVVSVLSDGSWRQLAPEGGAEEGRRAADGTAGGSSAQGARSMPGHGRRRGVEPGTYRLFLEAAAHVHHGEPVVAWSDGGDLRVYRAAGGALVELPSPADLPGIAAEPVLATGADGTLLIAWSHRAEVDGRHLRHQIQLRAWDGEGWRALGRSDRQGVSDTDADSVGPRLARAADGSPVVAWTDELPVHPPERRVYAAVWDGEAWRPLWDEGPTPIEPGQPALHVAVASAPGALAEAWSEPSHFPHSAPSLRARVRRGDVWAELSPLASGAVGVQLELEPSGRLTVLSGQVWRGDLESGWQGLGIPPRSSEWRHRLERRLALAPDGTPWLADIDEATHLWRWSDAGWADEGEGPAAPASAFRIDPRGRPVVAWSEDTIAGYRAVHVRVRGDDGWEPLGADPACGTVDAFAGDVRLVPGDGGAWALGWVEERPAEGEPAPEICLWNGGSWERLPLVGATSRSWGKGTWALTWLAGGPLVTWRESGPGRTHRIRASWWSGRAWVPLGGDGIVAHCDPTCAEIVVSAGELAWIERGARTGQVGALRPDLPR